MTTNEEDIVENIISLQTHDHVLFFTNKGKVYRIKGYEIPEFSRQSKGLPVVNLLPIEKDEKVMSILPIRVDENIGEKKITFVTKQGLVKRTDISEFENIRKTGKIVLFPIIIHKKKKAKKNLINDKKYQERIKETISSIKKKKTYTNE